MIGGAEEWAAALFAEMLDNFQHLKQLFRESQGYTLNFSHENLGI
jgi:hypothetical protein